ncbi:crp-like helix-turn-helix domain protein [Collimonas arenae]|uniref:Crp-like helix-turn-helix domain protein n=1 Tax=Collimonas arenae TaxID=279058 RepID=A0A127PRX9_9BURK|nr:Crp/Fnr family transcriptional regulator [Collimonas arenae]AMP00548.1 crp-like helix-turn-helix domain protein [Collimonas arenae]AMP10429.1 crp-like helix-turn-helix domain protein [Collimonas arenae]
MAYVLNRIETGREEAANDVAPHVATKGPPERKIGGELHADSEKKLATLRIAGLHGHNPLQNHLLAALPAEDFKRLLPNLEFVAMPLGMTVCEAGCQMRHLYFLTSSIVSLLHDMKDGSSAETAVIGNEGVAGIALFMGGGENQNRATVKSAGYGFRLKASILNEEFNRGGALQQLLLRYTQALITQMSQTAVCNRHHSVPQQLCRSLLLTLDRLPSNEICVTQSLIASMLGVRRESIAEAAAKLQSDGLIQYARGHMTILNRRGLEARACECYSGLKQDYRQLFPPARIS